jgi:hypothetical protein
MDIEQFNKKARQLVVKYLNEQWLESAYADLSLVSIWWSYQKGPIMRARLKVIPDIGNFVFDVFYEDIYKVFTIDLCEPIDREKYPLEELDDEEDLDND